MPSFKDTEGRVWVYEIDVPTLKRVRSIAGVDLLTIEIEQLLSDVADPIKLIDSLYACCFDQAESRGLTDDEFGRAMGIDPDPLAEDLLRALADFFPSLGRSRMATTLRRILDRSRKMMEKMPRDKIQAAYLNRLDQQFDRTETLMEKLISGTPSTDSLASQESLPTSPE